MSVRRIFVEKREAFAVKAKYDLLNRESQFCKQERNPSVY